MASYYCSVGPSGIKYFREDGSVVIDFKFSEMEVVSMEKGISINKVAMYRKGANITQDQMAAVLGIHVNTYRTLEDNPTKFSVEQVKKFVDEIKKYDPSVNASDIFLI